MRRLNVTPRNQWQKKFEELGFSFHTLDGLYWDEGVCYEFTSREIDHLERVTDRLNEMCLEAVEHIFQKNLLAKIGIPEKFASYLQNSWENDERSVYGRFDFVYDGRSEPRLLEYNADTPTSLLESSVAQWVWLEEVFPRCDQFNSIHEKLIGAFGDVRGALPSGQPFYFSCIKDHEEDLGTVEYMRDTALQAGLDARHIFIEDIGFSEETGLFCDLEENPIRFMFKLYPWEWLLNEDFGARVLGRAIRLFEPPWKMVLSNKGILAVLWEMFPGQPNLLPCAFDPSRLENAYVRKPLFSREGANITFYETGKPTFDTGGNYGAEGFIYQEMKVPPCFEGNYPVIGSWIVNGLPAGIGIREDRSPVTRNTSRFVPHFFKP